MSHGPPPRAHGSVTPHLATEFGEVMAQVVGRVAGACGAVLTDRDGHAIDYAHDATAIDELDLQIVGAQCSRALLAIEAVARRRGFDRNAVLLEASRGCLLGATLPRTDDLTLVLVLRARAHLGLALREFERACDELERMLA